MSKTILITGASSGLGAGMAHEFAAKGYDLALCARRTERLITLQNELSQAHGVRVEIAALDVDDNESVFTVFEDFAQRFDRIDRIIVNAGIGAGRRLGTGHFDENRRTIMTNFVAALAQCEAALQIFRRQNAGHLVTVSSMSAMRGFGKHLTTYAATKAALAALTEGIRVDVMGTPIKVTTLFPGYIRTELNEGNKNMPFAVSAEVGCKALVQAIEREPATACVPAWPWTAMGVLMRNLPLSLVKRFS
ncbi:MAG: SDR family oxidoreductase [Moraxellaceae bacterium]|nr:SDR family oxidoreductase [Moraxellaceae bacterium]MDZ4385864.1 SDR family oxidoreductase [Moraxellaceae bacterium]